MYLTRIARGTYDGGESDRQSWIDARSRAGGDRRTLWTFAYAAPAITPNEARTALRSEADYDPHAISEPHLGASGGVPPAMDTGIPDAEVGRVYLLADHPDEAIPHLRRAAGSCGAVFESTFAHVHASLDLGRALEAKNDRSGACDAYAKVLARFGKAKPRSISADAARARQKALACEP